MYAYGLIQIRGAIQRRSRINQTTYVIYVSEIDAKGPGHLLGDTYVQVTSVCSSRSWNTTTRIFAGAITAIGPVTGIKLRTNRVQVSILHG